MKNKTIVTYQFGSFIDYKGEERMIIACALSQDVQNGFHACWENHSDSFTIYRAVSIGFSIYNPMDKFNIEEGKKYAFMRATKAKPCMFIAEGDIMNDEITKALLSQVIKKFKPETIITNYKEQATKYNAIKESKDFYNSLSIAERTVVRKAIEFGTTNEMVEKCRPFINNEMEHMFN